MYKEGSRLGSAGFLKVENREHESRLRLKIQNIPLGISGRFPIRVHNGNGWKEINGITVQDGGGSWEEDLSETSDRVIVQVILPGEYYLEGRSKTATEMTVRGKPDTAKEAVVAIEENVSREVSAEREETPVRESDAVGEENSARETDVVREEVAVQKESVVREENSTREVNTAREDAVTRKKRAYPETILIKEELPCRTTENTFAMPQNIPECNLKEDKWEQILDTYEKIHPYGDERVYVKLEPKDFVILQSKYQYLVNNSFLLHGFYNYRYIILGKERDDYYLGVPGVFYEREKMVALMFGFEAFECPGGNVKAGEFGYYLRKVEL